MYKVDLNADLGESFGAYTLGMDEDVLRHITSANVACGFHAGDAVVMRKTVRAAKEYAVAVGAHPGFPDLAGFGRRNMAVTPLEAKAYVQYQIGALMAFMKAEGLSLQHVKPHGALYNMSAVNMDLAVAICEGIREVDDELILMGLSGSCHIEAARKAGIRAAGEVFADRGYQADGTLIPRSKPGAMITDENDAVARVIRMVKEGVVVAADGTVVPVQADSVCLHGDNPHAVAFAEKLRHALAQEGVAVTDLRTVLER
ncbi:MAG: LamB/YcsF family protein [Clostridiales bacterium]|nr:LamB/YcsF family protein [Clostridiales bacterium]